MTTYERHTHDDSVGVWVFCCCICECENAVYIDPMSDEYPLCGLCSDTVDVAQTHAPLKRGEQA